MAFYVMYVMVHCKTARLKLMKHSKFKANYFGTVSRKTTVGQRAVERGDVIGDIGTAR